MKKYIKFLRITACLFVGLLLFLTASGIFYFRTEHARRWVQDAVNQAIPGSISLKKMRFSPLNGHLEFENVLLKSPEGDALAGCDRLFLNLSWFPLFYKTIFISESILERPWTRVRMDRNGKINLVEALMASGFSNKLPRKAPAPQDKTDTPKPFNVVVASFSIVHGSIDYRMTQTDTAIVLPDIALIADANLLKKSGTLALHITGATLKTPKIDTRIDPIELNATLTSDRIDPLKFQIGSKSLGLKITGSISDIFDKPSLDLMLDFDAGLARIRNIFNFNPAISGHMTGHAAVQGILDNPDVKLHLDYGKGVLAGARVHRLVADLNMHDRQLVFKHVQADAASGQFNLSGDIDLQNAFDPGFLAPSPNLDAVTYRLHLQQKDIMLAKLFSHRVTFAGTVNGQLNLEGQGLSWQTLTAKSDLEVQVEKPAVGSAFPPVSLQLKTTANIARGIAELKGFSTITGNIHLEAGGHYDLAHDRLAAHLNLEAPNLDPGLSFFNIKGARGQVSIKAEMAGALKQPAFSLIMNGNHLAVQDITIGNVTVKADLNPGETLTQPRGQIRLNGEQIDLGVQKLAGVSLTALLDGEKARIEALKIVLAPDESITGSGWISYHKRFEFDLTSRSIALQHIDKLGQQNIARGNLVFDLSGSGELDNPRIDGNVAIKHLLVNGKSMQDVNLRLDLHDQLARISGRLNFDLGGQYDLKQKSFSVALLFDRTELAPYFKLVDREDLGGTLTAKIKISGHTDAMEQLEASADVARLDLLYNGRELLNAQNFNILATKQEISIPGLNLVLADQGKLDIRGKGSFKGPSAFVATGNIPLQVLHLFFDDIQNLTGNILVSARMEGTLEQPQIHAEIGLEKIGFALPAVFHKLHDINGRIAMTPRTIELGNILGMLDTGRLDLSGLIHLQSFRWVDCDLALKAAQVPLVVPDTLDMRFNADLKLRGSAAQSMLQGEAVLLEGTYYRDVNLSLIQAAGRKQREPLPPGPKNMPVFLKNMAFDIDLNARQPLQVDNNLAQLDIKPDLHLTGTPETPVISGRAAVESGTIAYRRNKFVVKKGIVDFVNPYKIEPLVDVESETRVQDWIIFLKLTGTPDNLSFQLASDPPEEDADILSLLLFHKTTRKLIQTEGGMTQSTESLLAEMISATWGEDIKKASGLDIVEIEGGGESDPNQAKLTLGKELSRRMTIKYALESKKGEMVQRAISEYKLLDNIVINGFQDNQGIFGGELKYRLEFR